MANSNKLDKLERIVRPQKWEITESPVYLHVDGETRLITAEERKKISGDFIRIEVHDDQSG